MSAFVCGLTTMKTPPASSVPKIETQHAAVLSMKIATRSPRSSPWSWSARASRARRSSSSAYVSRASFDDERRLAAVVVRRRRARLSCSRRWCRERASVATAVSDSCSGRRTGRRWRRRRHASASAGRGERGAGDELLVQQHRRDASPTSAISSVSPTPRVGRSPRTSRRGAATALGSKMPAVAQALGAEQLADVRRARPRRRTTRPIGARYGRFVARRSPRAGTARPPGAAGTSPRARAAAARRAAPRRTRRRGSRGTGSGPRSSAPSASGRPASAAGSPRGRS